MNRLFLFRLALDFVAAGLLVAGLAYYWLDNVADELIGTAMFVLIIVHNVFNRRWYGTISKSSRQPRGLANIASILLLLAAMLVLLVTSLMISRTAFSFLPLIGGYSTRQIHTLAAHWALVFVSIHIGMRWSTVMTAIGNTFGIVARSTVRTVALRVMAAGIAGFGIYSSFVMGMGSKLVAEVTIDFWDFEAPTLGFFVHLVSIMGIYICVGHYATKWLQAWRRNKIPATSA